MTGRKVSEGGDSSSYGSPSCFRRISGISLHGTGLHRSSGVDCTLRSDSMPAACGIESWKEGSASQIFFFFGALWSWRHSSFRIRLMLSPPLSVHAKTEISTILVLPGKKPVLFFFPFLFTIKLSWEKVSSSSTITSVRIPAVMTNRRRDSRHDFALVGVCAAFSVRSRTIYYSQLNLHNCQSNDSVWRLLTSRCKVNDYTFSWICIKQIITHCA